MTRSLWRPDTSLRPLLQSDGQPLISGWHWRQAKAEVMRRSAGITPRFGWRSAAQGAAELQAFGGDHARMHWCCTLDQVHTRAWLLALNQPVPLAPQSPQLFDTRASWDKIEAEPLYGSLATLVRLLTSFACFLSPSRAGARDACLPSCVAG